MDRDTILQCGVRQPSGCLTWPGAHNSKGYATVSHQGRMWLVHRLAYVFEYGEVPTGLQVCHKCDVRDCYEPTHLFAGTSQDNIRDMHTKGRASMPNPRGEEHGGSKLTSDIVQSIRKRHAQGESQQSIADDVGVCQTTVSRIVRRKTWTHVQ